jgi:mRNA interferase RelE/StbE
VWEIKLSKQAKDFVEQERITDDRILTLIRKFIDYLHGKDENIDVKKMKGDWKGYHRIRIGKTRIILKTDFEKRIIFIDRIDFRGNIYK